MSCWSDTKSYSIGINYDQGGNRSIVSRGVDTPCLPSDGNLVPALRDQSLLGTFWNNWSLFGPYFEFVVSISKKLTRALLCPVLNYLGITLAYDQGNWEPMAIYVYLHV